MHHKPFGHSPGDPARPVDSDVGARAALVFALVAERLGAYYEHGQWLTEAQGAQLCAEWLARSRRTLPHADRRRLSALSDDMARRMAATLSRQAGLFTAHEMMQALDPNHESELTRELMTTCRQLVDELPPDAG